MIEINLLPSLEKERRPVWQMGYPTEKEIKKRLITEPENSGLYCELGVMYKEEGDLEGAVAQFETALVIDRKCSGAYLGLASCTDDHERKLALIKKGVRLCPSNYYLLWNLVYVSTGSEENAYLAVMELLDELPTFDHERVHEDYISYCSREYDLEKALRFYRKAMQRKPDLYYNFFVKVLEKLDYPWEKIVEEAAEYRKNKQESQEDHKEDNQSAPPGCRIGPETNLSSLGDMLLGEGLRETINRNTAEFDAAVKSFEQRIAESPFDAELAVEYAAHLATNWITNRYDFTVKKLEELIRRDPSNSALHFRYGRFLLSTRDKDAAFRRFLIAYENPDFNYQKMPHLNDWDFYFWVGEEHCSRGNYGEAAIAFEKDLKEICSGRINELIEELSQLDLTDFDCAINRISPIISFSPELAEILRAQAIVKGERFSEADKWLKKDALKEKVQAIVRLKEEGCRYLLARELNSLGLYDDAIQTLDSIPEKGAAEHFLAGDSYESKWRRQGNPEFLEKAHQAYAKAARSEPQNMDCLVKLAYAAKQLGKHDELVGLWRYARTVADETDKEKLEKMDSYIGSGIHIRFLQAWEEPDPAKRIDLLRELDEEAPGFAKPSLAATYDEYAPILAEKMEALLSVR